MWLSKLFSIIFLIVFTSGCGFHPLYSPENESDIFAVFSKIHIRPIANRPGQLLRNELDRLLHPRGASSEVLYKLSVKLSEEVTSLGIQKSSIATRANLTITATYALTSVTGKALIAEAQNSITVSYNIFTSKYATLVAEKNARKRAIVELAQEIRHHVGVLFKQNTPVKK